MIFSLTLFVTIYGFWGDAQSNKALWIFKVIVALVVLVTASLILADAWRWLRLRYLSRESLLEAGRKYGDLQSAAATWQERAELAEEKLGRWDMESMHRGRLRVLGELTAAEAQTTFGETGLAVFKDGQIVVAAMIAGGKAPPLDSIFYIEGRVMHDVKAVVRCVGYSTANAVEFLVEEYRAMSHQDLLDAAVAHNALPLGMNIVAREQSDDFNEER